MRDLNSKEKKEKDTIIRDQGENLKDLRKTNNLVSYNFIILQLVSHLSTVFQSSFTCALSQVICNQTEEINKTRVKFERQIRKIKVRSEKEIRKANAVKEKIKEKSKAKIRKAKEDAKHAAKQVKEKSVEEITKVKKEAKQTVKQVKEIQGGNQ